MLQTYEGYLEKGRFYPTQPTDDLQGRFRVIVTIVNEFEQVPAETPQAKALREFYEAIDASDEEISKSFERVNFPRNFSV